MRDELLSKIRDRRAVVGVVGLGYVGLPLAMEFARAGFHVIGFDVDTARVEQGAHPQRTPGLHARIAAALQELH